MRNHSTTLVTASLVTLVGLFAGAPTARADIFQWEYINPADPSQGVQPSTTLCPDGAGANAVPFADFTNRDLTRAYLIGADLTSTDAYAANLFYAEMREATLTNVDFEYATLTGANLTGAHVRGAIFTRDSFYDYGSGISLEQLYSTASYQAHDLSAMEFYGNDLTFANFAGQNLTDVNFGFGSPSGSPYFIGSAKLIGADFSQATLAGTLFYECNLTGANLSQANLTGADFYSANLTGANLSGQNLANADFAYTILTDANLSGAEVRGARFDREYFQYPYRAYVGGITPAQLYSTASYDVLDLSGISLRGNQLMGVNLVAQNLTDANFDSADLTGANLTRADTRGAQGLDLSSVVTANMIWPDGSIRGLDLAAGQRLVVRDYAGSPSQGLPPNVVTAVGGMNIAATGQLDLGHSSLIVKGGNLAEVTALLASGAAELAWNGPGIASSAAAADPDLLTALGVMLNDNGQGGPFYTTFAGLPVTSSDVLVKYTYYGDADLSGIVDGTDYALIDNGYNAVLFGWFNGDFDYSGLIDGTDYALIDNAFNAQGAPLGVGANPVPEPGTLGLVAVGLLAVPHVARRRAKAQPAIKLKKGIPCGIA